MEHIAPQTENPEGGYSEYTEKFLEECMHSIGNFLLISKSHNCSIGNSAFAKKRQSYSHLAQQREVQNMTVDDIKWTEEKIRERKKKIIEEILSEY